MANLAITKVTLGPAARLSSIELGETVAEGDILLSTGMLASSVAGLDSSGSLAKSIALGNGVLGETISVLTGGTALITAAGVPVGIPLMLSPTPGKIMPVADLISTNWSTLIGIPTDANTLPLLFLATQAQVA